MTAITGLENVDKILHFVDDYGIAVVLLIGLIYSLYRFLLPVAGELRRRIFKISAKTQRIAKTRFSRAVEVDTDINRVLQEAMYRVHADWVMTWQFHNSVFSVCGFPFLKISVTHEATHLSSIAFLYQNLPLSLFPESNIAILQDKIVHISTENRGHSAIRSAMESVHQKSSYILAVRDEFGNPVGAFTVAFVENICLDDPEVLRGYASRISILIKALADATPPKRRVTDR